MCHSLFARKKVLGKGLRLFSSVRLSVIKQGLGTGCLDSGLRCVWFSSPLSFRVCFCSQGPMGILVRCSVCVMQTHTCMHKHGWITSGQTISYNLPLQLPRGIRARVVLASGHPMGWQHPFLGTMLLLTPQLQPPVHTNFYTLQKSHLKHSCQHMQVQLVQNQEASPQVPEVGNKTIYNGLICSF